MEVRRLQLLIVALLLAACSGGACGGDKAPAPTGAAPAAKAALMLYPRKRWRLASGDELHRSLQWLAHIVIMHRDSEVDGSVLRSPEWVPDSIPARTREQALQKAIEVAGGAQRAPERFAQFARQHSDDVVAREQGGALGGQRLTQLPAQYVDALVELDVGQVSQVIETELGFHIIRRLPLPPDEQLSGRRVVVRYAGTAGGIRDAKSTRTRAQALRVAAEVAARARAGADFDALVAQYSECMDRAQGGDLGVYSLREPSDWPRELERLSRMKVGEISEPFDSVLGVQVLLRTKLEPRREFAMESIAMRFDPHAPAEHETSMLRALERARAIAAELSVDATRFAALAQRHGKPLNRRWTEGRGPIGVTPSLAQLAIGAITAEPVESFSEWSYLVARRIDPSALPSDPPAQFEIPNPEAPDMEAIIRYSDGATLANGARSLVAEVVRSLDLDAARAEALKARMERLAVAFSDAAATGPQRVELWRAALVDIERNLGARDFELCMKVIHAWTGQQMMQSVGL